MEIETSFGAMVRLSEPLTEPRLAVTETAPLDFAVRMPVVLTETIPAGDDCHVTDDVMSFVELSLYLPIALNCSVSPTTGLVLDAPT